MILNIYNNWYYITATSTATTTNIFWKYLTISIFVLFQVIGGHIVSGHVDGLARIVSMEPEGDSVRFLFEVPDEVKAFIAEKGSVCLDGVSLTVNAVQGAQFGVNIISHTQSETTFNDKKVDDLVNLEVDMLARYVARLTDSLQNTVEWN